ncbi:hypothetical protein LCGC14_2261190, partial [marine sediment metagenome]
MNQTQIEWCKNPDGSEGYTWNPITGCLHDCSYCWARKLANGRLKSRMLDNDKNCIPDREGWLAPYGEGSINPFYPRIWPGRLEEPETVGRQRGIFVCSMGDLFGIGVPHDWTAQALWTIRNAPQHRFYLLTKQPQNLAKWSPFPDNCWVGVSATNMKEYLRAIVGLRKVTATVKYISFEPLLERLHYDDSGAGIFPEDLKESAGINWVIIGAQTKPTILPEAEWVEDIISAADNAGLPVFLKDSLKPLIGVYPEIVYPKGVKVTLPGMLRQEMP